LSASLNKNFKDLPFILNLRTLHNAVRRFLLPRNKNSHQKVGKNNQKCGKVGLAYAEICEKLKKYAPRY